MKNKTKCSYCSADIFRIESKSGFYFCCTAHKGLWQIQQRESLGYTKDWLIDQYITKGKSANQIAIDIGRNPKRIWEWMRDYGIEIRPRGTDYGQGFKNGCQSAFKGHHHSKETKEMIRKARIDDGHVPYLKDGKHWLKHDGAISPAWKGGVTPERQAFYSSETWRNAVASVWRRDNAICQKCGKNHNEASNRGSFHIHHIASFQFVETRSDVNNLVLLCKSCHLWVHSRANINLDFLKGQLK